MIAKHIVKSQEVKGNFGNLVDYLTDSQGLNNRVGKIAITNCDSDDLECAKLEILATQMLNTRSKKDKTYHLLLSFDKNEKPSEAQLKKIEDEFCKSLGFDGHQRVSVQHDDTDNFHVHIAINKVNPKNLKIVDPIADFKILAKKSEEIELRFHLKPTNHEKNHEKNKARDFEAQTGLESFATYMKRNADILSRANSWKEVHQQLASIGVELKKRGNGLIFVSNGECVKASTVNREFSLKRLEARLGSFEKSDIKISGTGYNKDLPLKRDPETLRKWQEYKEVRSQSYKTGQTNLKNKIIDIVKDSSTVRKVVVEEEGDPQLRQLFLLLAKMETSSQIQKEIEINKANQKRLSTFKGFLKTEKLTKDNVAKKVQVTMEHIAYSALTKDKIGITIYEYIRAKCKLLHLKSLSCPAQAIARERLRNMPKRIVESRKRKGSRLL